MSEYKGNKKKYYPSKRSNNTPQKYHRKNNKPAVNMCTAMKKWDTFPLPKGN